MACGTDQNNSKVDLLVFVLWKENAEVSHGKNHGE